LAKRRPEQGRGLGRFRWVVERTNAWLQGFRKLRCVTAQTKEMQFAFFHLALARSCFRFL
jgi:transposase